MYYLFIIYVVYLYEQSGQNVVQKQITKRIVLTMQWKVRRRASDETRHSGKLNIELLVVEEQVGVIYWQEFWLTERVYWIIL